MGSIGTISETTSNGIPGAASNQGIKQPDGLDFTKMTSSEQLQKIQEMQNAMGQTGLEAGNPNASSNNKLYVNTGKSMCINKYLNTDGASIDSDFTDWDNLISKSWVKDAIGKLDKGMKPLSESVKGYKYMTPEALGKMLNMDISQKNINTLISQIATDKSAQQKLNQALQNTDYTHKAYTSISYIPSHSSYDGYPIRLNIVMTKGKDAIVTNNHAEHEIVGGRNAKYNFTNAYVQDVYSKAKGKIIPQLMIDVFI